MLTRRNHRKSVQLTGRSNSRSGAAAVEAAICFPLIVLVMLGTLEIASGLYLRESTSICCFEACRIGTRRGATAADVLARAEEVLEDRDVSLDGGGSIEIIPNSFSNLKALDPITVRITASTVGNSIFVFDNLAGRTITSEVTMIREFDD